MHFQVFNDGPLITETNYWELPGSQSKYLISVNAATFRVLLPNDPGFVRRTLQDMGTAREAIISRGPCPRLGLRDAYEILFEDGSDAPFALHTEPKSFDRLPSDEDTGSSHLRLTVWTAPRGGRQPVLAIDLPAYYRRAPSLPWLKPR